jgi:peptide/nickel transport system permease protein
MWALLARRILLGLLVMWVVSMLVFAATELLPGDVARAILGSGYTEEAAANIRIRLGLDRPGYERYLDWLGGLFTGDLGESFSSGYKISEVISERFWNTLRLAGLTAVIAVPLAIFLGIVAAIWAESPLDRGISIGTLCLISVPEFFMAALLVFLLSVQLQWLPPLAYVRPDASFWEMLNSLALPITTLTFAVLAHMARMTRTAILSVLASPYIEQAVLKGASRTRIILLHALPNALAPIINVVALNLAYLISGVVVVETMFNYPGLGKVMVEAVIYHDIPLVQAVGMVFCATYVGLNLLADVLAILANPRLRHPK